MFNIHKPVILNYMRHHLNGVFALVAAIAFLQSAAQKNTTKVNTAAGIVNLPSPYATPSAITAVIQSAGRKEKRR